MREERKMIRVTTTYERSGIQSSSVRFVGTEAELAEVLTRALKGNVRRVEAEREAPPYEAAEWLRRSAVAA